MRYSIVFNNLGKIFISVALLMILPTAYSLISQDGIVLPFLFTTIIVGCLGALLLLIKHEKLPINAIEGLVIVAIAWIVIPLIGALPYFFSGYIPNFIDAFFESTSGFTTTGSTILFNIEALPQSLLLWRSFTQWIGGLGILVFILAIFPDMNASSYYIMQAESARSKVSKLISKVSGTARLLCLIYISLSIILFGVLCIFGLDLFNSACLTFSTAGTGGFAPLNGSIADYNSATIEIILIVFMFLFSINFALFYVILLGQIGKVFKNEEFLCYVCIIIIAITITTLNTMQIVGDFWNALRQSSFQVVSIISSTGYATTNVNAWPLLSQIVLLLLMFIGGSSGSTAGGFKVYRVCILGKNLINRRKMIAKNHSYSPVKYNGEIMDEFDVNKIVNYFLLYITVLVGFTVLLSLFDNESLATTFSASLSSISNIGPGLDQIEGLSDYNCFSGISKVLLSFEMLFGRLEIIPFVVLLSHKTWKKSNIY